MRGEGDPDEGLEARLRKRDGDEKARAGCGYCSEVEMREIWQEREHGLYEFVRLDCSWPVGRKLIPTRGRFGAGRRLRFSEEVAWRTERKS